MGIFVIFITFVDSIHFDKPWKGFSAITLLNLNWFGQNSECEERHWGVTNKYLGEIARGSTKRRKNVFFGAGVRIQLGSSATYPARILTIFELANTNGESMVTIVKTLYTGGFADPKCNFLGSSKGGVLARSLQLKCHNFGQQESFQGPTSQWCSLCWWVLMGDVRFGRYDPQKTATFSTTPMMWVNLSH